MKNKRNLQVFVGTAVVLALAAMTLFPQGCSKLLPTSPGEEQVQGFTAEELWPAPPADLSSISKDCSAKGSAKIGPSGGALTLEADCLELDFVVPGGALTEQVCISASAAIFTYSGEDKVRKGIGLVFKPDGFVFSQPAEIELEASLLGAKDGDVVRLYWYNPNSGLWQIKQVVVVRDAQVELKFEVSHFSRYAISR